jgi:hypothetical protein
VSAEGTSPDLEDISVGNVPVREVEALVCSVPLEDGGRSTGRWTNPLLVSVSFGACPDLQFGAVGIDAVSHVDTLKL